MGDIRVNFRLHAFFVHYPIDGPFFAIFVHYSIDGEHSIINCLARRPSDKHSLVADGISAGG
jgi:hypothetical protein